MPLPRPLPRPPAAPAVLLLCALCALSSSECPADCSCPSSASVFCFTRRAATVPQVPASTARLYVFHNGISSLGADDLLHLEELQMLDLSQNRLSDLPDGAFRTLHRLKNLDLSSNLISHISAGSFVGLVQLERLYLHANLIQNIQSGAFDALHSLLELKLQGNLLTSVPPLSFHRLLLLDLSNNNLLTLGPSELQTPHLEALKVSSLGLTSLDSALVASLRNLHYLDISMNQLLDVPPALRQESLRGLLRLNLAGNPLGELKAEDFSELRGLQELDLSGLNLQSLPEGLLQNLPRLVHLTAAENPFNCLCPLAWFSVWIREREVTLGRPEETRCHFPLVNAGRMLSELEHQDFGCLLTSTPASTSVAQLQTAHPEPPGANATAILLQAPPPSPSHLTADQSESRPCPAPCLSDAKDDAHNQNLPALEPEVALLSPRRVTSSSILLDLRSLIRSQPQLRGIRLTYRNLSGPDQRPIVLRVPASYPEYTLRGLRPNCTYSVCASALAERAQRPNATSATALPSSCTEARTAGAPPAPTEPRLAAPSHTSGGTAPALVAVAMLMALAVVGGVVLCLKRKRGKGKADTGTEANAGAGHDSSSVPNEHHVHSAGTEPQPTLTDT